MNNLPYGAAVILTTGMTLMLLGFFLHIGGRSTGQSAAMVGAGVACEIVGFILAYLGYKKSAGGNRAVGAFIPVRA